MYTAGNPGAMIGKLVNIAEKINRGAADRRKENLQVWTRHQLWIHASGLLKKRATQAALAGPEPGSAARQLPYWINRYLDDGDAAILVDNPAVGGQPPGGDGGLNLRKIETRARHGKRRPDVQSFRNLAAEVLGDQMAPRIEPNDPHGIAPLRERCDGRGRVGIGEGGATERLGGA